MTVMFYVRQRMEIRFVIPVWAFSHGKKLLDTGRQEVLVQFHIPTLRDQVFVFQILESQQVFLCYTLGYPREILCRVTVQPYLITPGGVYARIYTMPDRLI